jgi:hypothetical protein
VPTSWSPEQCDFRRLCVILLAWSGLDLERVY